MPSNKSKKMKKSIIAICLLFATFAIQAQSKVGTIDIDFIITSMPEIESVQKNLQEYGVNLDKQLQDKMKDYQVKLDDYNQNVESFTEQQMQEKQTAIYTLEEDITKFRQNGIQLMRIREDELKRPLYVKIGEAMDVIAKENSFTQVLNTSNDPSIVYLDPDYDITFAVLAKMGIEVEEE